MASYCRLYPRPDRASLSTDNLSLDKLSRILHTQEMDRPALAHFLKRRRDALTPEEVGLEGGRRRRTHGLRREEVALLAHMSTDFYARLEQQRGSRPSEQTVVALTRALKLNRDEEEHLFALSGHTPPARVLRSEQASASLQMVLDQIQTPAQIVSDLYVPLSQNAMSVALFGDQSRFQGLQRNIMYRWFTEPGARDHHPTEDHHLHTRAHVAALRLACGRVGDDPEARELIAALLRDSAEFVEVWERHEVTARPFTRKRFLHPKVGLMTMHCQILTAENQAERLIVLSPFGPEDKAKLEMIRPGDDISLTIS